MSGGFSLSDEQKRLWGGGPPLPGAVAVVDLAGPLDAGALRAALAGLAARHEALRSRLVPVPGLKAEETH